MIEARMQVDDETTTQLVKMPNTAGYDVKKYHYSNTEDSRLDISRQQILPDDLDFHRHDFVLIVTASLVFRLPGMACSCSFGSWGTTPGTPCRRLWPI